MVSGCVTSLTNGWSGTHTGLCEAGGEENPWRDTFGSFSRLLQWDRRGGGGRWGGHKDSNSSSVFVGFYKSDECAKSGKWLNWSNG